MIDLFRYRKQLTLGLVAILIFSLAASLFSGVINSGGDEVTVTACEASDSREIQTVVTSQAFAFRSRNVSGAYAYFSSNFQEDIDKERFSLIAGTNYPMLLSGGSLIFGECRVIDIGFAQAVTLTGDSGTSRLLYFLSQTDGAIKVEGITVED